MSRGVFGKLWLSGVPSGWSFLKALVGDPTEETKAWISFPTWWRVGCERLFVFVCQPCNEPVTGLGYPSQLG